MCVDFDRERQFDVIPIPTPTDLQPLPTGRYGLPLLANRVSNTCFKDPTYVESALFGPFFPTAILSSYSNQNQSLMLLAQSVKGLELPHRYRRDALDSC
jgi:hypothetical protein